MADDAKELSYNKLFPIESLKPKMRMKQRSWIRTGQTGFRSRTGTRFPKFRRRCLKRSIGTHLASAAKFKTQKLFLRFFFPFCKTSFFFLRLLPFVITSNNTCNFLHWWFQLMVFVQMSLKGLTLSLVSVFVENPWHSSYLTPNMVPFYCHHVDSGLYFIQNLYQRILTSRMKFCF